MKRLFLDDERFPNDAYTFAYNFGIDISIYKKDWIVIRSYGQFVNWIKENGLPEMISFDHDLADVPELRENLEIEEWFDLEGNREYTGKDCANWLINYCLDNNLKLPICYSHSMNTCGRENIKGLLDNFKQFIEND